MDCAATSYTRSGCIWTKGVNERTVSCCTRPHSPLSVDACRSPEPWTDGRRSPVGHRTSKPAIHGASSRSSVPAVRAVHLKIVCSVVSSSCLGIAEWRGVPSVGVYFGIEGALIGYIPSRLASLFVERPSFTAFRRTSRCTGNALDGHGHGHDGGDAVVCLCTVLRSGSSRFR